MNPLKVRQAKITDRRGKQDRPQVVFTLTVPPHMGRAIPSGERFVPEFTEDGILYRRVDSQQPQQCKLPDWIKHEKDR